MAHSRSGLGKTKSRNAEVNLGWPIQDLVWAKLNLDTPELNLGWPSLSASLRCGLNTMILQNIDYGFKRQQVAEIGQRSLNSAIAPAPILLGHSNHQRGNLGS